MNLKDGFIKDLPKNIRLEASTICQLNCPLCPTGRKEELHIGRNYLKFTDFKDFIDKHKFIKSIELSNYGEIFLNPELDKIIKYAYENNIYLTANNGANLNNLNEGTCETLVKYKFRSILCSIDGASADIYKIYRRGGDFNKVIENIKNINRYKKLYRSKYPLLRWQFVIFGHNEHQVCMAERMAGELNMSFKAKPSWDASFSPLAETNLIRNRTGLDSSSYNYYFHRNKICTQLWSPPQINWDGRLLGCCVNFWGDYGSCFGGELMAALNNEKIVYARKMLLGITKRRPDIPCDKCLQYEMMERKKDFLTMRELRLSRYLIILKRMIPANFLSNNGLRVIGRIQIFLTGLIHKKSYDAQ